MLYQKKNSQVGDKKVFGLKVGTLLFNHVVSEKDPTFLYKFWIPPSNCLFLWILGIIKVTTIYQLFWQFFLHETSVCYTADKIFSLINSEHESTFVY